MNQVNPYAMLTAIIVANIVLWTLFVAPIIYVVIKLLERIGQQVKDTTALVRDFACFAASIREDYVSARFMAHAADREDKPEITVPAGASEEEKPKEPEGFVLTQRG